MSADAPRTLLHICNGGSTSALLARAGVPGRCRLFCDLLLEGPCPPLWDEPWRRLRLGFLTGGGYAGPDAPGPSEEIWDVELAELLAGRALEAAAAPDEIVLWYEHDLFDQLLLVRLCALFARQPDVRPALSLVSIGEHPDGRPGFKGLGELTPQQLASLFSARTPIDAAMIALGRDAWAAYTDPDPRTLATFVAGDLGALPFLARALRRHLEEYPGAGDGLSRTERTLLGVVAAGVNDPARVWQRIHASESCLYVTDRSYLDRLARLAAPPALLTVSGPVDLASKASGGATLSLTALGKRVLRGEVDWLPLADPAVVERWLGGVHIVDAATAWRWDAATARLWRAALG